MRAATMDLFRKYCGSRGLLGGTGSLGFRITLAICKGISGRHRRPGLGRKARDRQANTRSGSTCFGDGHTRRSADNGCADPHFTSSGGKQVGGIVVRFETSHTLRYVRTLLPLRGFRQRTGRREPQSTLRVTQPNLVVPDSGFVKHDVALFDAISA